MAAPTPWFVVAGLCSLGAGVVHAVAVGAHGEHREAAAVFTLLATAQVVWGAVALLRRSPAVAAVGTAVAGTAVVGWLPPPSARTRTRAVRTTRPCWPQAVSRTPRTSTPRAHRTPTPSRTPRKGVAGGRIPDGEQRLCDHAHGTGA